MLAAGAGAGGAGNGGGGGGDRNGGDHGGYGGCKALDVIQPLDGTGDVHDWIRQVRRAAEWLKLEVDRLGLMFLRFPATTVYDNLPEESRDFNTLEAALIRAFSITQREAYNQLRVRRWQSPRTVGNLSSRYPSPRDPGQDGRALRPLSLH